MAAGGVGCTAGKPPAGATNCSCRLVADRLRPRRASCGRTYGVCRVGGVLGVEYVPSDAGESPRCCRGGDGVGVRKRRPRVSDGRFEALVSIGGATKFDRRFLDAVALILTSFVRRRFYHVGVTTCRVAVSSATDFSRMFIGQTTWRRLVASFLPFVDLGRLKLTLGRKIVVNPVNVSSFNCS